jgi:DNA-binding response OmpR family regulator
MSAQSGFRTERRNEPERTPSAAIAATRQVFGRGERRTLDSHASRRRRKLNRNGDAAYVLNVWGVGYRLTSLS